MPLYFRQETRAQIRRRIGYLMFGREKFLYDTVLSSATAQTFVIAKAMRYPAGALVGRTMYCVSGTGSGQYGQVLANALTGQLTLAANLSTPLTAGSVVELWPELITPDDANEAIDRAILRSHDIVNIFMDAPPAALVLRTGSTMVTGVQLPASMVRVASIRVQGLDDIWREWRPAQWEDQEAGDTFYVQQGVGGSGTVGAGSGAVAWLLPQTVDSVTYPLSNFHCLGYRLPVALTSDSQLAEVHPQFLLYYGAAMLEEQSAGGPQLDPEQHAQRGVQWLREAAAIEARMGTNWLPNTMEIPW